MYNVVINYKPFFEVFLMGFAFRFLEGAALALFKEKMIVSLKDHRVNFSNYERVVLISWKKR